MDQQDHQDQHPPLFLELQEPRETVDQEVHQDARENLDQL